jgi:hypothetical protein
MITPIAYGLAIVLSLFIIIVGVRFLVVPRAAAVGYGVPAKEGGDAAYLTIKGLRDSSYGVLGLALLAFAGAHVVGWFTSSTKGDRPGDRHGSVHVAQCSV